MEESFNWYNDKHDPSFHWNSQMKICLKLSFVSIINCCQATTKAMSPNVQNDSKRKSFAMQQIKFREECGHAMWDH